MTPERTTVCVLLGLGVLITLYYATANDNSRMTVPDVQTELQVMGLGVKAGVNYGAGTPLDIRPEVHFWAPGFPNVMDLNAEVGLQPMATQHRYPAVPGGNTSTVMHKGISSMMHDAPANNDWFRNPPEAAVL